MKTLVIILAQTRAHELTYESFERHLLNPLKADLCVCASVEKKITITQMNFILMQIKVMTKVKNFSVGQGRDCVRWGGLQQVAGGHRQWRT